MTTDLISRDAVIEILAVMQGRCNTKAALVQNSKIWQQVKDLPPVQQERKGHWTETEDGWDGTYYVCSECGCPWTLIDGTPEDNGMKYCQNCGAKMEGTE